MLAEPVLSPAPNVNRVEAFRLDRHGFTVQQTRDAGLPGLGMLGLAIPASRRVVWRVFDRLLVRRHEAFEIAQDQLVIRLADPIVRRSEERRVGKECRSRW